MASAADALPARSHSSWRVSRDGVAVAVVALHDEGSGVFVTADISAAPAGAGPHRFDTLNAADAVLPHRPHALFDGSTLDLLARRLLGRELLEALAHREELEDADPPAVARLPAAGAPVAAVEGGTHEGGLHFLGQMEPPELVGGRRVRLGTVRAQLPRQALREDGGHGRTG